MISSRTRAERNAISQTTTEGSAFADVMGTIVGSLLTGVGMGLGFYLVNRLVGKT